MGFKAAWSAYPQKEEQIPMRIPTTYADWVDCFERFVEGQDDEEMLYLMEQGTLEWKPVVAEKLTQRVYAVIEFRLKQASEQLNLGLSRAGNHETEIVSVLVNARKRFAKIKRVASLQAFPANVQHTMNDVLSRYVQDTQASLEESARSDRSGQLRMTLKNNSLVRYDELKAETGLYTQPSQKGMAQNPKKRRVIF
ncbi:hypothetical protein [Paenibacillus sp. y28]|uniref:hypothetical protein n=1 Tax=Paenibacillus sp. y28 TaxID=3129110 RepID=UPI0030173AEF